MTIDEVNEKLGANRIAMIDDFDAGMSYRLIAEKYNIPIGTVKSRISRGREIIKRVKTDEERENEN
jgi:DNA-directed RNA polymerase specialized sigma24 family protein